MTIFTTPFLNYFLNSNHIFINNNTYNYIPLYIKELMRKYSINMYEIEINWKYLNSCYSFLKSFLCFNRKGGIEFVNFDILFSSFNYCKKISINGGMNKKLKINIIIINYLYDWLLLNYEWI
eukprot:124579_1